MSQLVRFIGRFYKRTCRRIPRWHFQEIPHITNEIKNRVYRVAEEMKSDVVITEIGGTVGDIESLPLWRPFVK